MFKKALLLFLISINAFASAQRGTFIDIGVFNDEYLSKKSCETYSNSTDACWSLPTGSREMGFIMNELTDNINNYINDNRFAAYNSRKGGSTAQITKAAKEDYSKHGKPEILLRTMGRVTKMPNDKYAFFLSGSLLSTVTGQTLGNAESSLKIQIESECIDESMLSKIKKECFKKVMTAASDSLAFQLTNKLDVTDERFLSIDIDRLQQSLGQAPRKRNTANVHEQDRDSSVDSSLRNHSPHQNKKTSTGAYID
jgi:hypothetical protein